MSTLHFIRRKMNFKTILLILSTVMTLLAFSAAAAVLYSNTTHYLAEKSTNLYFSNLSQISKKIEMQFSEIENVTKRIAGSTVLKELMDQYNARKSITFDKVYFAQEIRNFMGNVRKYTDSVDSILIVTPEDNFSAGERELEKIGYESLRNTAFYDMLPQSPGKAVLLHLDSNVTEAGNDPENSDNVLARGNTLFAGKIIFDQREYGIILVKIKDSWMKRILDENGGTAVIDGQNTLWQGKKVDPSILDFTSKMQKNEEGVIASVGAFRTRAFYKKLSWGEWYLVYFEDPETGKGRLKYISSLIIIAFFASAAISILLSGLILNKLTEPFNNLIENVRRYKTEEETGGSIPGKRDKWMMRERILCYFAFVILVPMTLFILSYYIFAWNSISEELVQFKKNAFQHTAENIGLYMERKLKAISSMSYDRAVQEALVIAPQEVKPDRLHQVVNGYLLLTSGYDDITLYNREGKRILSTYNKDIGYDESFVPALANVNNKISWLDIRKDELNRHIFSLVVKVNGSDLDSRYSKYLIQHIGNIVIRLNESELEQIYRDIYVKSDADIFITDSSGSIISNVDKSRISLKYRDVHGDKTVPASIRNKRLTFNQPIQGTPWILVGEYGYESIFDDFKPILYYSSYLLAIIFLFLVIISSEISYRVAYPIGKMNRILRGMRLDGTVPEFPRDSRISEVDELAGAFNDMVTRIDMLIDDMIVSKNKQNRLETQKREAEILALQSQIKPHFLCNTLESIRCLVREKKEEQATDMIKNLSDLFRYGISREENLTPVRQELAYAAAYTRIMHMRFENMITFQWDIEEEIEDCLMPKMLLQPVIENAIYHGIVPKKSKGTISVQCRRQGEHIVFTVSDDGMGMEMEKIRTVMAELERDSSGRIGLHNVNRRLKLYYGEEYGIHISGSVAAGTRVCFEIPVKTGAALTTGVFEGNVRN